MLLSIQCLVWNTYGPIDEAMNYAYGWSDSTVAFMANWGTIMFVVAVVPLSLMLEKRYLYQQGTVAQKMCDMSDAISLSEWTLRTHSWLKQGTIPG